MSLLLSLILIITFIIVYMLMIKIFTVLFLITGLTKEKAHFQVISLLTNSGFSTNESELITTNRSRRRIAKVTMITGTIFNVVIASLLINILFNINLNDEMESLKMMGIAAAILIGLMIILKIPFISRGIERLIEKVATKINDKNHHDNIITELDSYGKRSIVEVYVSHLPDEIKGKTIEESCLKSRYDIIVLLIQRNGRVIDAKPSTILQKGDKLVLFGKTINIKDLFNIHIEHKEELIDDSKINNLSIIDNYGVNALTEIEIKHLPEILVNKSLSESILKEKYDINVLMVKHDDKVILVDAETKLSIGDNVILIGPYQHIKTLFLDD